MSIFNAKFAPDVFEPVKAPILARCQSLWVRSCFGLRVILCYLLWPQGFTYVRRKGTPSKKSVNLDKFGGILCNKVGRRPSSDARTAVAHILLLWRDQVLLTRKVDLVVFEVERLQANFAWYFPNIIAYYALLRNFLPAVGPIEVHWSSSKMHSCWRIPLQGDHEGIHVFLLDPHHSWFTVILLIPPPSLRQSYWSFCVHSAFGFGGHQLISDCHLSARTTSLSQDKSSRNPPEAAALFGFVAISEMSCKSLSRRVRAVFILRKSHVATSLEGEWMKIAPDVAM